MDLTIKGSEDLGVLAKRLKEVGGKELKKELLRGIRAAAKPTIPKIRANALAELPKRGGLAAIIAKSKIATKTSTTAKSTGVRIVASNPHNIKAMNAGVLRHPVFGNRKAWKVQSVPEGWFTRPIEGDADPIRREVQNVMAGIAAKIERN